MKNPPTRPYTLEELEVLLREETLKRQVNTPRAVSAKTTPEVIFKNNQTTSLSAKDRVLAPAATPQKSPSQLSRYTPFIVVGIIAVGMGIYLYYEHRKIKENEAAKNRLN